MREPSTIKKISNLVKNLLRIFCVIIFIHWIFWATTYARAPQYYEAIDPQKNKEITHHEQKTLKYRGSGWLDKVAENKQNEMNIEEIEEDVIGQIETETKKKNLPREWKEKQLPELEKLKSEITELEKKKSNLSESEKKELSQKEKDYSEKLKQARQKTVENIKNQLNKHDIKITDLNDKRGFSKRLFIDPLKFFLINPLNKASKVLGITNFSWPGLEIIFKIAVVKLFCLWISYPEWISIRIQENMQRAQNPQLSNEEREQVQQETSSLFWYWLFNGIIHFFLPMFFFLHPAHFDRTKEIFLKDVPYRYLLIPLLIVPFLLSVFSTEFLRQKKTLSISEIKTHLTQAGVFLLMGLVVTFIIAWQNQGNYWWVLLGFGVDFLFNLVRIGIFHLKTKSPPSSTTFKVTRVKGSPDNWERAN